MFSPLHPSAIGMPPSSMNLSLRDSAKQGDGNRVQRRSTALKCTRCQKKHRPCTNSGELPCDECRRTYKWHLCKLYTDKRFKHSKSTRSAPVPVTAPALSAGSSGAGAQSSAPASSGDEGKKQETVGKTVSFCDLPRVSATWTAVRPYSTVPESAMSPATRAAPAAAAPHGWPGSVSDFAEAMFFPWLPDEIDTAALFLNPHTVDEEGLSKRAKRMYDAWASERGSFNRWAPSWLPDPDDRLHGDTGDYTATETPFSNWLKAEKLPSSLTSVSSSAASDMQAIEAAWDQIVM